MRKIINHDFLSSPTVLLAQGEISWAAITLTSTGVLQKTTFTDKTFKSRFRMSLTSQQHKEVLTRVTIWSHVILKRSPFSKIKTNFKYRKQFWFRSLPLCFCYFHLILCFIYRLFFLPLLFLCFLLGISYVNMNLITSVLQLTF